MSILNVLLELAIKFFTKFEKYPTMTEYKTICAVKITIAFFLNTVVIATVVYWGTWYGIDSLTTEMTYIIIINAVVSPLVPYVDPERIVKWIRIKYAIF